ncbi:MAG: aspartate/glutamate racemase family protein [Desulfobacterales bacterium]|nr:aspartate/glutamate racemase family protein [Desulfobacterales bacterium]
MPLVGLVHSTRLVIDAIQTVVATQCPDAEIVHVLDEGILRELTAAGKISPEILDWLTAMVLSTEKAGASLAVVSCSSLSPGVNDVRKKVHIPVLKIDEPMMAYAVKNYKRIGLLMTNPTTEKPSRLLFEEVCQKLGRNVTLIPRLCPDAFKKLDRGDIQGHDTEVVNTVKKLLIETDGVLLAQISILRVRERMEESVKNRVFSSLDFIAPKINQILNHS